MGKALRKTLLIVVSLLVLVGLLAYLSGALRSKVAPGEMEPGKRRLGEGQQSDVVHRIARSEMVEIVGTLRAERRTEISSRVMATINEFNVRAGENVRKGDVLVRLDDRDLQARVQEARQGVNAAQADLQNAEKDFERFQSLLEQKVISRQEYDQTEARYRIAQARLQQARESAAQAETMLSFSVIRAPVDGKIIDKLANVGDTASPGRPLLSLYDPTALRLEAAVPEALASGLTLGERLQVRLGSAPQGEPLEGTIEEIVPQADVASRSVLVKVRVSAPEGTLEGAFGRLLIPSRERVRLCLPISALREAGQLRFVDVVKDGGILERRQVQLGEASRLGRVEVLSGVEAGERVVLYGPAPPPLGPDGVLFDTPSPTMP